MAVHGNVDWSARMDVLEHKLAQQRKVVLLGVLVGVGLGVVLSARIPLLFAQTTKPLDTLTVRELIVVDAKGVERVRIGAPLPGPIVNGRRVPRQGVVSGVLIYDAEGDERGGYVTEEHGDAMLTLDAKGRQQTIFIANRDGGANLAVWSGNNRNDNYVSVQAVPNPLIEIKQNGKTRVFSVAEPRN